MSTTNTGQTPWHAGAVLENDVRTLARNFARDKACYAGLRDYNTSPVMGFVVNTGKEVERHHHPNNLVFRSFAEQLSHTFPTPDAAAVAARPGSARLLDNPEVRARIQEDLGDHTYDIEGVKQMGHTACLVAMRDLAFLANAWVHCSEPPAKELPRFLGEPLVKLAQHLGIPPIASYLHYVLVNGGLNPAGTRSPSPDEAGPDDFRVARVFTSWKDEAYFYQIHQAIEVRGARAIRAMAYAANVTENPALTPEEKNTEITKALQEIAVSLRNMTAVFKDMRKFVDPDTFFLGFRHMLEGTSKVKDGVVMHAHDGETASDIPVKLMGGSGAQSDLIKMLDRFLGVTHKHPAVAAFIERSAHYSLPGNNRLLDEVGQSGLRLRALPLDDKTKHAFDQCCFELANFRLMHRQAVMGIQGRPGFIPAAVTQGTGGSYFVTFLRGTERASLEAAFKPLTHRIAALTREMAAATAPHTGTGGP